MTSTNSPKSIFSLMNAFWDTHDTRAFSVHTISLHYHMMHLFNRQRWPPSILATDELLAATLHMSRSAIRKARQELVQSGLLFIQAGGKGRNRPTRYFLSACDMDANAYANANTDAYTNVYAQADVPLFNNKETNRNYGINNRKSYTKAQQRTDEITTRQQKAVERIWRLNQEHILPDDQGAAEGTGTHAIGLPFMDQS